MSEIPVYYETRAVGRIEVGSEGPSFVYDSEWLRTKGAFPISILMPLSPRPIEPSIFLPWAANLLPEGRQLTAVGANIGASTDDVVAILREIGRDTAGALSIGVGFGLQSIVNNFVSGLILLIERPIKVGDRVVVGGKEGHIRRINVRATEIETFDRATVIVPNSEIVSTSVTNWTHRDRHGRAEVQVGVAYGSDPEKVRDVLLACAKAHPCVAILPEPIVAFKDFASSSLDFILLGFVDDVENKARVESELRYAIVRAFAENGIEIPFPQREVRLKDLDRWLGAPRGGAS